jgi:hypothetical protein
MVISLGMASERPLIARLRRYHSLGFQLLIGLGYEQLPVVDFLRETLSMSEQGFSVFVCPMDDIRA